MHPELLLWAEEREDFEPGDMVLVKGDMRNYIKFLRNHDPEWDDSMEQVDTSYFFYFTIFKTQLVMKICRM